MNSEAYYLGRVEEPRFFRAQDDIPEGTVCCECERPIKQGEAIAEVRDRIFIHADCVVP